MRDAVITPNKEIGCAVKTAIDSGIITLERFNSYKKQLDELQILHGRQIQYKKSMTKKERLREKMKFNK